MKQVIIVNNNLDTGGVQKALINLIKEIHNEYQLTLCIFKKKGGYLSDIPKDVKIIELKSWYKYLGCSQSECRTLKDKLIRGFLAGGSKIFGQEIAFKLISFTQKKLRGEYDCAISYLHGSSKKSFYGGCNEFVLKKVKAKNKIAWVHCDFEKNGSNTKYNRKVYTKFDKIVACSDGCMQAFVKCNPNLEKKCFAIRNCNDYKSIMKLAGEERLFDKSFFNVVTVARLSKEKGIERGIEAVKYCVDKGYNIKFNIVGAGPSRESIENKVKQLGIENNVVFYGNQVNPYPYIRSADLFMLTSYHEAAPVVFDEASCLNVPILATQTTSTKEMLIDTGYGVVCENNQKSINEELLKLIENKNILEQIKQNSVNNIFNNSESIKKFKEII